MSLHAVTTFGSLFRKKNRMQCKPWFAILKTPMDLYKIKCYSNSVFDEYDRYMVKFESKPGPLLPMYQRLVNWHWEKSLHIDGSM